MPAEPLNPYAAPELTDDPSGSKGLRRRWGQVLVRIFAVVAGFSLLADPSSVPGVEWFAEGAVGGAILARLIGLAFIASAFLPWRVTRAAASDEGANGDRPEGESEEL